MAPYWRALQLTSRDFGTGPRFMGYLSTDRVGRARALLDGGDALEAAQKARLGLEEFLQEWCEGIVLPFHSDGASRVTAVKPKS